jgi:hypothetical protein
MDYEQKLKDCEAILEVFYKKARREPTINDGKVWLVKARKYEEFKRLLELAVQRQKSIAVAEPKPKENLPVPYRGNVVPAPVRTELPVFEPLDAEPLIIQAEVVKVSEKNKRKKYIMPRLLAFDVTYKIEKAWESLKGSTVELFSPEFCFKEYKRNYHDLETSCSDYSTLVDSLNKEASKKSGIAIWSEPNFRNLSIDFPIGSDGQPIKPTLVYRPYSFKRRNDKLTIIDLTNGLLLRGLPIKPKVERHDNVEMNKEENHPVPVWLEESIGKNRYSDSISEGKIDPINFKPHGDIWYFPLWKVELLNKRRAEEVHANGRGPIGHIARFIVEGTMMYSALDGRRLYNKMNVGEPFDYETRRLNPNRITPASFHTDLKQRRSDDAYLVDLLN